MSNLDTMPTKIQIIIPIPFQHTANTNIWHYANKNQGHWAITTPAYSQWQIWTQYSHKFRSLYQHYSNIQPIIFFYTMPTKNIVCLPTQLQHTANVRFEHRNSKLTKIQVIIIQTNLNSSFLQILKKTELWVVWFRTFSSLKSIRSIIDKKIC